MILEIIYTLKNSHTKPHIQIIEKSSGIIFNKVNKYLILKKFILS